MQNRNKKNGQRPPDILTRFWIYIFIFVCVCRVESTAGQWNVSFVLIGTDRIVGVCIWDDKHPKHRRYIASWSWGNTWLYEHWVHLPRAYRCCWIGWFTLCPRSWKQTNRKCSAVDECRWHSAVGDPNINRYISINNTILHICIWALATIFSGLHVFMYLFI